MCPPHRAVFAIIPRDTVSADELRVSRIKQAQKQDLR